MQRAQIASLGVYFPETIRGNDWWPETITKKWSEKALSKAFRGSDAPGDMESAGAQRVKAALVATNAMPFAGAIERRILPNDQTAFDMELAAAKDALSRSKLQASDLDFLLIHSVVPDYLHIGNGPRLHEALGMRRDARVLFIEGICNSFQHHLEFASMLIETGRARCGIMIQSNLLSRLLEAEDPTSLLMGDAATAQVITAVGEGKDGLARGLIGTAHVSDGSVYGGVVTGVPNARWYDDRPRMYVKDALRGRQMFLSIYDAAAETSSRALAQAKVAPENVRFIAGHQATVWLQGLIQEACGVPQAKRVDTFPHFGSLSGANLPFALAMADRENMLADGDIVLCFSGAAGQTSSASVLRWGPSA